MREGTWIGPITAGLAVIVLAVPLVGQTTIELPERDRALDTDFEDVYRVGSFDGDLWETFGEIAGLSFDAAGNLFILDRQASRVTVVDPSGSFLRAIGQPGDGPGEFRMPVAFTAMPSGGLVVADLGHRSYQLFDAGGSFERMVSMGGGDMIRVGEIAPHASGTAVVSGGGGMAIAMRSGPGGGPSRPETRPIEVISLTGDVAETETIVEAWQPPRDDRPQRLEGGGVRIQMSMAGPRTFEPELLVGALRDGGVAYADSSTYRIRIVGSDGRVRRELTRDHRPREVTNRMRRAERDRRLDELEEGEGPRMRILTSNGSGGGTPISDEAMRDIMRGQIEQLQFYPELPVLMDLKSTWRGRIWAQRRGDAPTEPGAIDVMTPEGRYEGTFPAGSIRMPAAFGPDGLTAWIERDEFDVPTIVVKRLPAHLN